MKAVRLCAGVTFVIGSIVIIGWAFSIPALKSVLPTFITMKANTALSFILCSMAAILTESETATVRRRIMARLCVVIVMAISFLTLLEYLFQYNFMIDELLFSDPAGGKKFPPGRLAPITAINFILFGAAIFLSTNLKKNYYQSAQIAIFLVFIISFQGFVGYFLGITYTFGIAFYSQMAVHTTVAFVFLCLAYLFAHPNRGLMGLMASSETRGGQLVRNLTVSAILIPPFVTWACILGERLGLYDSNFSILMRVLGNVIFFLLLVWKNGVTLHDFETKDKRTGQRQTLLAQATKQLISSMDYEINLKNVVQSIAPEMADLCWLNLMSKDGQALQAGIGYADSAYQTAAEAIRNLVPVKEQLEDPTARAIFTGASVYMRVWDESATASAAQSHKSLEVIGKLSPKSLIAVPITFQGKILGAFTAIRMKEGRPYDQEDFAWFEELAIRTAIAINNALLYQKAQLAIKARDEFLSIASHELRTPLTTLKLQFHVNGRRILKGDESAALQSERISKFIKVSERQV
ncbi:MAG: GAF domain-containing protein, partial [Bacteriovorax sp.]